MSRSRSPDHPAPGSAASPSTRSLTVRDLDLRWGSRTFIMAILNVTPDSFSGDGLLSTGHPMGAAVLPEAARRRAVRMAEAGADIIDIGGHSTRPGHDLVALEEELARVMEVVPAVREALPGVPLSIDTTSERVAEAALDAGADILNDVSAVTRGASLAALAGQRGAPYIVMHARSEPDYRDVVEDVRADLEAALGRALAQGCAEDQLIVDPGIGFGKTAGQNLALLRDLPRLKALGRPLLLGASRKSTIGRVLGLPPEDRLEGTLAVTALGIAGGVDVVRVHDVRPNLRAARMADAIVRASWRDPAG